MPLTVLLVGCALSPQSITVRPILDVSIPPSARPHIIQLQVRDMRSSQVFGTRGGIYNTALLEPRTDITSSIYRSLAERLRNGNFNIVTDNRSNSPLLEVRIKQIQYSSSPIIAGGLINEIRINALFEATARHGNRTLSGQYQATSTQQVSGYPSAEANEKLINKVTAEALRQLLSDQKLLAVLRG